MKKNSSEFFCNKECAYYPCHRVPEGTDLNCLFCYCPLYALGRDCGGNFTYLENGVKDCSSCLIPHSEGGYRYVLEKYPLLMELAKDKTKQ